MSNAFRSTAITLVTLAIAGPAAAASPEIMMAQCRDRAHTKLHASVKDIETKYEGQRTDGTHAVNGTAYLQNKTVTFQCSFNKKGSKIIRFVANKPENSSGSGEAASSVGGAPARDQKACLSAVAKQTNNDVVVMSTETSEANNLVVVGVGVGSGKRAPWKCLVKNGSVAEIMSLTDEGAQ